MNTTRSSGIETIATQVELPAQSRVLGMYAATNLADAYSIGLPDNAITDPKALARFIFGQQSPWVDGLMRVRDFLVAGFGLKTSSQLKTIDAGARANRIGIFRIYESNATEVVLGEDDKHLDFRLSVLRIPPAAGRPPRLIVSTVVQCHNRLGRTYLRLVTPFHRFAVPSSLRRAAQIGWPLQAAA